MSITLPVDLAAFVQERVSCGAYAHEQDVLRSALELLQQREKLLAHIDEGTHQLANGEYREYAANDRELFMADMRSAAHRLATGITK